MIDSDKHSFGIQRLFSRSISKDLTMCFVLIILITATLVILVNYYLATIDARKYLNQKADEYVSYLVGSLEIPLWDFDNDSVFKIGQSYSANELIAKLRITEFPGRVVFSIAKEDKADLIKRTREIIHDGQIIGHIELSLTSRLYKESNRQLLWTSIFTIIVVVISLSIAAGFLFKVFLRNPLDNLIVGINQIAQGDYEHKVSKAKQSEIKAILSKFDYMAEQIKGREDTLNEVNRQLEKEIAERKRAEEALRESEKLYRLLADNVTDVIWVRDMNLHLTYVSPSITHQTGYSVEETMDRTLEEALAPDSLKLALEVFAEELEIEQRKKKDLFRSGTLELEIKCKDGSTIWTELKMSFLRDKLNNPIGIIGVTRDITDRKHFEAQLRQAHKMESIGTLAGGIAHDFNNILGIVLGNTELALDDVPEWNPARLNLEEVRTASLRAKDVVRQLLSFARKTRLEKKPTNIIPITKETLKLLRASIPTSIEIRQNIPKDVDTILADPTQINQVLINLCTNADHAMPDGGIIVVTLKNVEIDEDTVAQHPDLNSGRYVNLTVSDTGYGISREKIDRIFDPYYTTKEVGKGTGMGLAVVHGIVKGHNGLIAVESELGKGTTFSIFFPVVVKGAIVETETDEKLPTGSERILFVDDEESMVYVGRYRLERLGYKIDTRTNPVEALELFRTNPDQFDLIITDMTMPQMTGDILVKEILKIRPDMSTILCTGFHEKIDEKRSKELGISAYIEKPLDRRDLAKLVRKVLDEK